MKPVSFFPPGPRSRRAFTLVELLVVITVVAILAAVFLPVAGSMLEASRGTACVSNLRQIGAGIAAYAADNDGKIPYGPRAPAFTSPGDLYPSTGSPTSLLSLRGGAPAALGLTLKYLANPRVLFCPGADQRVDADAELAKVGKAQAQGGYYYRHAGNTELFDRTVLSEPPHTRLANLGENRNGLPLRALVLDSMFLCSDDLAGFEVKPRSNHHRKFANILFADGHVATRNNDDARYDVDVRDSAQLRSSFDRILKVFEQADAEP